MTGFFQNWLERFRSKKRHKLLHKFQIRLDKELDLEKIIHRLRFLVFTAMGLLTADQNVFVDTMSKMTLHESSDFEETSTDEELHELKERKDFLLSIKRLIRSSN